MIKREREREGEGDLNSRLVPKISRLCFCCSFYFVLTSTEAVETLKSNKNAINIWRYCDKPKGEQTNKTYTQLT